MHRLARCAAVAAVLAAGVSAGAQSNWKLVWSDEFNGPAGSAPDPAKWTYDVGASGWGNNELEFYTKSRANSYLDGKGHLVIKALRQQMQSAAYTSARLKTQDLFSHAFGKFEARIRIPYGQGIWPAFWMLGNDIASVGWPRSGEIDIMENIGKEPGKVHGSVHGPGYDYTAPFSLAGGAPFKSDFHVYGIEWDPGEVRFYVDGAKYGAYAMSQMPAGAKWVFGHPFFILLNVAVGGNWPGSPDQTSVFPQYMVVDYVRVYRDTKHPN